jgi:hypothetical protein
MDIIKLNQIILLMFMVSKMNINILNIKTYIKFWSGIVGYLTKNINELKSFELKSVYYSLGKVGFLSREIEELLC